MKTESGSSTITKTSSITKANKRKEADKVETIIITVASVVTSVGVILGVLFAAFRWYLKQEKQDADIKTIKEEQTVLTRGVLACLKGLKEQGCDGPVTEAIDSIEKHLNEQAHK